MCFLSGWFEAAIQYHFFDFRVGDNLNIKVADFGLARDVYIKEYYRQQSIGKVPVRWMAPEALHDKISNEKTDVVSHQLASYLYCHSEK